MLANILWTLLVSINIPDYTEVCMNPVITDTTLIAACGLYCGACSRYLKEKCPGCAGNNRATWCAVRSCTRERHYSTCAECADFSDVNDCKKFNNMISKLFGFIFRSNRKACIEHIRNNGSAAFAAMMTQKRQQSIRR